MRKRFIARGIRIVVAFVGWIVFAWLCSWEAVFGGACLMNWLNRLFMAHPLDHQNDIIFRGTWGDIYVRFAWLGLVIAAGASFALFTLEPVGKRKLAVAIYGIIFAVMLPLSVANYFDTAFWALRLQQAIIDVILVALGLAAIQRLLTYHTSSVLGAITRPITIFLLGVCAVLVPAIYAVIWFSNATDVAKSAFQADGFLPSWITGVSFALSAMVAVLTFRYERIQPRMET